MIGHGDDTSESWDKLPWKKLQQNLFRLQIRLFKAVKAGDMQKARSLQKLILKSKAARLLAIRQVTPIHAGKKTAGIDGKASLNHEERFRLEETLKKNYSNWHLAQIKRNPNTQEGR